LSKALVRHHILANNLREKDITNILIIFIRRSTKFKYQSKLLKKRQCKVRFITLRA
jgi:hypothetical protein